MARYARIASGQVAEIIVLPDTVEPGEAFHPDFATTLVSCPDPAVVERWTYAVGADGKPVFAAPPVIQPTPAEISVYAATKRFTVETGGITVNGAPIATDRDSQGMIGNAYAYVQASGAASVSYKTTAGFVTLTADQIKAVALAVGAHVQACFKAEDDADAGINATPPTITTFAQVDAMFAGLTPVA